MIQNCYYNLKYAVMYLAQIKNEARVKVVK